MTSLLKRSWVMLLGLLLISPAISAQPSVESRFEDGVNTYLFGDYQAAIQRLDPLVHPNVLLKTDQAARAYELLGLAYFFLDKPDDARREFETLLRMRPDHRLNPVVVPPPAVSFFDGLREALKKELDIQRKAFEEQRRQEEERRKQASVKEIQVETVLNSRLVALMPFGLGQFQNEQPAAGAAFLASELVAVGLSISFFLAVEDLRQDDGLFSRTDVDRAKDLQTAQLASGGIALTLMLAGAFQAWLEFDEVKTTRRHPATPSAAGLLHWEF